MTSSQDVAEGRQIRNDLGPDRLSIRKLSFIVQLTDPAAYEGGGVELLCAREPYALPNGLGAMAVFLTYLLCTG